MIHVDNSRFCLMALLRQLSSGILWRTVSMSSSSLGPVATSMQTKLSQHFSPQHLEIINESHMHNVPRNSETHFKVLVVSEKFQDTKLIARHRMVNDVLSEELRSGVHALSIVAKTPDQWTEGQTVDKSPACRGGFGK